MNREAIKNAIAYMSHPDRIQDTCELRKDLASLLPGLQLVISLKPISHPWEGLRPWMHEPETLNSMKEGV